ncbi:MAG: protein kinase [Bacteroidetes bacterium]|nr:protein kinase [Bacteroidota bacterium]
MPQEFHHTIDPNPATLKAVQKPIEDFSVILDAYGLEYKHVEFHRQVGEINKVQGWILHISVVRWQVEELLRTIIPLLINKDVPFKIIKDKDTARNLLDGNLGYFQIGKVISIYPESDTDAIYLTKELIQLTMPFKGPKILTDVHLGANVYTRYGSFNPVMMLDAAGNEERYIYNHKGELVPDIFTVPFALPEGVTWPFADFANPIAPPTKKIFNKIYKPTFILKSDAKGNVFKSIYLKKLFIVKWCVIKEGKRNMWSDEAGRDIPDRLIWQKELHDDLAPLLPLPKIIDLFLEGEDMYLAMEFIQGQSLMTCLENINRNCLPWFQLSTKDRLIILDWLLQVIRILMIFHQKGYVHRDITPMNFLVNKKNRLFIIDNELAYSVSAQKPFPPFEAGTHGFMSPEQLEVRRPNFHEDIYGLGATMIVLLTDIYPISFDTANCARLTEHLSFFIKDKTVADMIAACVDHNPERRPSLSYVQQIIERYRESLLNTKSPNKMSAQNQSIHNHNWKSFINDAITGLVKYPTIISKDLWQSEISSQENIAREQKVGFGKSPGLYQGISGPLYLLARAHQMDYDISSCHKAYQTGWEYIMTNYLNQVQNLAPGLYGGAAGMGLALCAGMKAGLLEDDQNNRQCFQDCMIVPHYGLDFANGLTGQAIVALQGRQYLDPEFFTLLMNNWINVLENMQEKDGHWVTMKDAKGRSSIATSFAHGNTGIIWFLLKYAITHEDEKVKKIIAKALDCLNKEIRTVQTLIRKKSIREIFINGFHLHCIQGMILLLIKTNEVLREEYYKQKAEELLNAFPANMVHNNFNQDLGLAGLGELYLEAFRVFKNEEWKNRAGWISDFFFQTHAKTEEQTIYWLGNNSRFAVADFMTGNAGIIHFLMRCEKPLQLGYRLLE